LPGTAKVPLAASFMYISNLSMSFLPSMSVVDHASFTIGNDFTGRLLDVKSKAILGAEFFIGKTMRAGVGSICPILSIALI
jgi:hypothetical protein